MTTQKPPVPSSEELFRIWKDADPSVDPLSVIWLAGYHARDAERDADWNAENWDLKNLLRNENKLYREASEIAERRKARITELEALACDWREKYNRQSARLLEAETRASKRNVAKLEAEVTRIKSERDIWWALAARDFVKWMALLDANNAANFLEASFNTELGPIMLTIQRPNGETPAGKVARLEAEVAELREDRREAQRVWNEMCEEKRVALEAAPRRTPELTERVARHLLAEYGTEYDGTPWEDLTDSGRAWFLEEADAVLDLVFGKERE